MSDGALEEAQKYVNAMRLTGQQIGADLIEAGFEDLKFRTALEASQAVVRVLREYGHQDLAERVGQRLGDLWRTQSRPSLDNFYG